MFATVVTQFENEQHSPPRRGGVAARSIRSGEATLFSADGVVSSESCAKRNSAQPGKPFSPV
jgi:hypothetical protein